MADDVQVKFGADSSGITTGAKQALDGVKNFSDQAKSHVEGLTSTFGKLQEMMLGIAAIVAGGALFKEMVNSTLEMTGEVTKLQKAFGMSLEEANKTKSSLDLLGISTDTYTQMATRLDRQLRAGSESLTKMGLTAKDLDLGQKGLMDKAIGLLGDYKAGVDRNIAAQVLFGRGGDEATKLLRLGLDSVQQKAKELEEQFHLTITPQDQANARQYKLVVSELGMAFDGIKKAIGEAVLPYLTAFGNWFVQIAPKIIGGMREGMAGVIEAAFSAAEGFINFVTKVLNGVYNLYVVWEYIQAKLGNTTVDQANSSLDQFDSALKNLSKFRDDAVGVIRDLKAKVLAAKPFESIDLAGGAPSANKSASGLLSDNSGSGRDATSAAMKDLDGQMKVLREGLAQKKELLAQELAQHQITEGQKVDATRQAVEEEYRAELALLQRQLQIGNLSLSQRQTVLNKIKELEAKHRTEELQLDGQAVAARQKLYQQFFDSVQSAFNGQLRGLLAGTTTWTQAFKSILGDLIISFIQAVEKMVFQWVAGELAKTTATEAGVVARTASEGAGAAASMATTFASVIKSITASAAETFAGIFGFLSPVMGPAAAAPAGAGMATVSAVAAMVPALDVGTPWVARSGLAMIHEGEAVVPAQVNGAWQNGGGGGDTHVHFGINAIDAQNGAAFLKNNMGMLAKLLASHLRTNPGVSFA